MQSIELRTAYDRFFATAEAVGPDTGRDDDGWTVAHVVAHVAANDGLILAFVEAAVAGGEPDYDNDSVWRTASVRAYLDTVDGWPALLLRAHQCAEAVLAAVEEIDEATAVTRLGVHIVDGGVERINAPIPLAAFIRTHAVVHLPSHTAQINSLRHPRRS